MLRDDRAQESPLPPGPLRGANIDFVDIIPRARGKGSLLASAGISFPTAKPACSPSPAHGG
jgi:hypothetical protein